MFRKLLLVGAIGCLVGLGPQRAVAGPFADDMAKCMVNSTSDADRGNLVRWIFAAMSLNPKLATMANISPKEREVINEKVGKLFSRLVFKSCRTEVVQAVRNEGPQTVAYAFQILGQVAARGLMMDPHVLRSMKALGKIVDQKKLKALLAAANKQLSSEGYRRAGASGFLRWAGFEYSAGWDSVCSWRASSLKSTARYRVREAADVVSTSPLPEGPWSSTSGRSKSCSIFSSCAIWRSGYRGRNSGARQ